jgi:hypothetical protein
MQATTICTRRSDKGDDLTGKVIQMELVSETGRRNRVGAVRVLTSPEDLAAAVARAKEFERRNAEILELRAQRHEAALARLPWRNDDAEEPTLASA